jgi:hypothetical protein
MNKESLTITDNRSGSTYEIPLYEGNSCFPEGDKFGVCYSHALS